jgi:N-acetylglutamate synthase-like GNAT family acetyltransferase
MLNASEAYGIDAPDGHGLAGTVVITRWGADCAAIGLMIVASRYGGRGLGRTLMGHALDTAGEGVGVSLFATSSGRPLYDKLGFRPVRRSIAFRGRFRVRPQPRWRAPGEARAAAAGAPGRIRVAAEADLPQILALDRVAYGADREPMLSRMPGFAEKFLVFEADEGVTGYAAAWRTEMYLMVGPLMAPDAGAARRLVTELAADSPVEVRLDLDPDRPELPGWARAHGLAPTERTTVMTHGGPTPPGLAGGVLFCPISVAMA